MKISNILIILGIFSIIVFSTCGSHNHYQKAPTNINKTKILKLINNARTKGCNCGSDYYPPVNKLVWNDKLEKAAQNHSNYMNTKNKFSHKGKNGSNPGTRISKTGYNWSTYGENIAAGNTTEEDVIQGWLDSPGHCSNLMNPDFTEVGVATSGPYWTQVFAKPH